MKNNKLQNLTGKFKEKQFAHFNQNLNLKSLRMEDPLSIERFKNKLMNIYRKVAG